jgi:hypothetical protein
MIFTRSRSSKLEGCMQHIGRAKIERKTVERFLRVLINENLSLTHHIVTKAKMCRYVGIKKIFEGPASHLQQLITVTSHLQFSGIWGSINRVIGTKLPRKKVIRAIMPCYNN